MEPEKGSARGPRAKTGNGMQRLNQEEPKTPGIFDSSDSDNRASIQRKPAQKGRRRKVGSSLHSARSGGDEQDVEKIKERLKKRTKNKLKDHDEQNDTDDNNNDEPERELNNNRKKRRTIIRRKPPQIQQNQFEQQQFDEINESKKGHQVITDREEPPDIPIPILHVEKLRIPEMQYPKTVKKQQKPSKAAKKLVPQTTTKKAKRIPRKRKENPQKELKPPNTQLKPAKQIDQNRLNIFESNFNPKGKNDDVIRTKSIRRFVKKPSNPELDQVPLSQPKVDSDEIIDKDSSSTKSDKQNEKQQMIQNIKEQFSESSEDKEKNRNTPLKKQDNNEKQSIDYSFQFPSDDQSDSDAEIGNNDKNYKEEQSNSYEHINSYDEEEEEEEEAGPIEENQSEDDAIIEEESYNDYDSKDIEEESLSESSVDKLSPINEHFKHSLSEGNVKLQGTLSFSEIIQDVNDVLNSPHKQETKNQKPGNQKNKETIKKGSHSNTESTHSENEEKIEQNRAEINNNEKKSLNKRKAPSSRTPLAYPPFQPRPISLGFPQYHNRFPINDDEFHDFEPAPNKKEADKKLNLITPINFQIQLIPKPSIIDIDEEFKPYNREKLFKEIKEV